MSKAKKSKNMDLWVEVKKTCRLNQEEIQMARELGLNPKKLIANHSSCKHESWKATVGEWIQEIHRKQFGDKRN